MALELRTGSKAPVALMILIAAQSFCAVFFVSDALADYRELSGGGAVTVHQVIEYVAALSLAAAVAFEVSWLVKILRRQAHLEQSLRIASAAVYEVIEAHFDTWDLSPSERDVANFLVKGLSTSEIAGMRGSAEGTVKAHLNAIYRKSGTRSRAELLSGIIDSLMAGDAR